MEGDMRRTRATSSPELVHGSTGDRQQQPGDPSFGGVSSNVKLLLRLIQEYKEASMRGQHGSRDQRISEIMFILDDVKSQIQKSQVLGRRREAELRRCNTDVKRTVSREKKLNEETVMDEKEKLRRELNASLVARKSLESICASIGKEKEIIAKELARKVHQMQGLEELVNDLRAQNEMLLSKVQICVAEHKTKKSSVADTQGTIDALHKKNKALSKQLLKSLDVYRSLKRKLRDSQERNDVASARMEEMGLQVRVGLERIHTLREMITRRNDHRQFDIEQQMSALEHMFECFDLDISNHIKMGRQSVESSTCQYH